MDSANLLMLFVVGMLAVTSNGFLIEIVSTENIESWYPEGQAATLTCRWNYIDLEDGENIEDSGVEVVIWRGDGDSLMKITNGNPEETYIYVSSPMQGGKISNVTDFYPAGTSEAQLTIEDFNVDDPEEYACEIAVGRSSKTGLIQAKVYAEPAVYVVDVEVFADITTPIEPVLAENATEATPLEEVDEEPEIVVKCVGVRAYPRPTSVEFFATENENIIVKTMSESDGLVISDSDEKKFFNLEATLRQRAVKELDGKSYGCRVNLPSKTTTYSNNSSSAVDIRHDTSEVSITIEKERVLVGENVIITCMADGNPRPIFRVDPGFSEQSSNVFELTNIDRNSPTKYKCIAIPSTMDEGDEVESPEAIITVNYLEDPVIENVGSSVTIAKSGSQTLNCVASGNPQPDIAWFKDGRQESSTGELYISNAEYSQSGKYECVASSSDERISSKRVSVDVQVQGACEASMEEPLISSSATGNFKSLLKVTCIVTGNPKCDVRITQTDNLKVVGNRSQPADDTHVLMFNALQKFTEPVSFSCTAKNSRGGLANKTLKIDEKYSDLCCEEVATGGLSTGAVIGIILLVLVVLVGIPIACYFVKKRNAQPKKQPPVDAEAQESEKEGLNKDASSEMSDSGSLPPPPADMEHDHRLNSAHEMTTFSTNK